MRWRKTLMAGGAALGAVATLNEVLGQRVPSLDNLIGGEEGWFEWRDRRIFFTRRGDGPPILLLHGIHAAAWSYEWRSNVDPLARSHTVYTIDLLGFGRSDRPNARYSPRLFMRVIDDFARKMIAAPCALVASSLTAAYAAVLGARDPGRFPALVLVEPTGLVRLHEPPTTGGDVGHVVLDVPVVGTAVFNALVSRRSIRYYLRRVYVDPGFVTDELVEHYYRAAHQPGARYAPATFLSGHLNIDVRTAMRRLRQPALLVWGEQAVDTPIEDVRGFRALKPDLELAILDPAGMLPHDEQADGFNTVVLEFLSRVHGVVNQEA